MLTMWFIFLVLPVNGNVPCPDPSTLTTCPVGQFFSWSSCSPCAWGNVLPDHALITAPSLVYFLDYLCPWSCNTGYYAGPSNCLAGTNCSTTLQSFSTVYSCLPLVPTSCPPGQYYTPPTPTLLATNANMASTVLVYNPAKNEAVGTIGRQCVKALEGYNGNDGSHGGFYSNASFGWPVVAQQSGAGDVSMVFDLLYGAVYLVNRANGAVSALAGTAPTSFMSNTTGLTGTVLDGVGTKARFGFGPMVTVGSLSHSGNVGLIFDTGVMRYINTSNGNVTTLTGSVGGVGYAEGTRSQVLYNGVTAVSMSPDGSFALVVDLSMTVRYLNVSTATSSFLLGRNGYYGSSDGVGTNALMFYPQSVAVSNSGLFALTGDCANPIYSFADPRSPHGYPTIRYVNLSAASLTTIAGRWNHVGLVDGKGTNAYMYCPMAITIASDDSYALFLDQFNSAVRTLDLKTYAVTTLMKFSQSVYFFTSIGNLVGPGSANMSASCMQCPAGQYTPNAAYAYSCVDCPAGYYAQAAGSSACTACPVGTYTLGTGSSSPSACLPCTTCLVNGYFVSGCSGTSPGYCSTCTNFNLS